MEGREDVLQGMQELVSANAQLRRALERLGGSRDTDAFRSNTVEDIHESSTVASNPGTLLRSYTGDDREKLRATFARELRVFQQSCKEWENKQARIPALSFDESGSESPRSRDRSILQQESHIIGAKDLQIEIEDAKLYQESMSQVQKDAEIVADLMKDFNVLLVEQQDFVDSLENNSISSVSNLNRGQVQVQTAVKKQKVNRCWRCSLLIILCFLLAIGAVVVYILTSK